ncbi:hypothetical protein B0J11DRAFT_608017 [Dendryphion nanum]|uniref:KANL3/Tex30 alpha/beta hydrolase-like domain-containing protein n=1 Tax=Dendryphion nanum TaxID=256645 RepID=A0A9P9DNM7_9PLEO|nr:hypothetical protein B0J11DRAFT_608017 [Dendryphion nanum]
MPTKRRKATEEIASGAPEPKRRSQRLAFTQTPVPKEPLDIKDSKGPFDKITKSKSSGSKKTETQSSPEGQTKPTKSAPKTQKQSTTKSKSKSKSKSSPPENEPLLKSPTTASPFHTLTLQSPLLKSPIPCHTYSSPSTTSPTLIFTHGAGGTLSAPAVLQFCSGFSTYFPILVFQGSMNLAARTKGFHACIKHLSDTDTDEEESKTILLGGRSMGSRAAIIALKDYLATFTSPPPTLLILVSYPLKGPNGDMRSEILFALPDYVKVLFVIGDRDHMCPLDELEAVRGKMGARSWLVVVRGADHGMSKGDLGERAGRRAGEWVRDGEVDWGVGGRVEVG